MIKYIKYGLIILFAGFVNAQKRPVTSSGELNYIIDYSVFYNSDSKAYVDFDLMLYTNNIFNNNKNIQPLTTTITTNNQTNSAQIFNSDIKPSSDTSSIEEVFYESWTQSLEFSKEYLIEVKLSNTTNNLSGIAYLNINIPSKTNAFSISDLQLISKVSDEKTGMVKSGKRITPNPSRRFGLLNPVIYIYYELYNLPGSINDEFDVIYSIEDNSGTIIKKFPSIIFPKKGNTNSILHAVNSALLPSGVFNLKAEVTNIKTGEKVITSKEIEIIQVDYITDKLKSDSKLNRRYAELLEIIADKDELKKYNELDTKSKGNFIISYFKKLDPNTSTVENEYLKMIQQRFNYANDNFGWGNLEGFKTDRGRIILKYGMPNDVQRYDSEANAVPYEIWNYNVEKSYFFVFADLRSDGRYALIHSTKEGEVSNSGWKNLLRKM